MIKPDTIMIRLKSLRQGNFWIKINNLWKGDLVGSAISEFQLHPGIDFRGRPISSCGVFLVEMVLSFDLPHISLAFSRESFCTDMD
jgi:hypothetical protein